MATKENILQRVRKCQPPVVILPPLFTEGIEFADRRNQFLTVLEQVGGQGIIVPDLTQADHQIRQLPVFQNAKQIVTLVEGVGGSKRDLTDIGRPHELVDVDVAIAPGRFAVAENGAVWITDADIAQRAIYFICQHLVLVVPASEIVDTMHQAYQRLGTTLLEHHFGCFLSGPSKTADIEQSLVIGAQGPRSHTVVLVENM